MPDVDYLSLYSANDHVVLWPYKLNAAEQVLCVCAKVRVCENVCVRGVDVSVCAWIRVCVC